MNLIDYSDRFYSFAGQPQSAVTEITLKKFEDKRGWFAEKLKGNLSWIKQVNHSSSVPGVFRGFHAQKGDFCQGKLVENLSYESSIYDTIIDARPDSDSFGCFWSYELKPLSAEHNMLWVPRGFLHSFVVPDTAECEYVSFQYFCDNIYDKESEISIRPSSVLPNMVKTFRESAFDAEALKCLGSKNLVFSEKDENGSDYVEFMSEIKDEFETKGKLWYSK